MKSTWLIAKSAAIVAISLTVATGGAQAASLSAQISIEVSTPMTMTQTQSLDFGAISAVGTITVDPNSSAISDQGAQAGEIKVNVGAAQAIPLTVTVPATATLSDNGAGDDLDVTGITVGTPTMGAGSTGDCSAGCNVSSADNGDLVFPLGATLSMAVGNGTYPNDTYSGQFTIMAAYQ